MKRVKVKPTEGHQNFKTEHQNFFCNLAINDCHILRIQPEFWILNEDLLIFKSIYKKQYSRPSIKAIPPGIVQM